MNESRFNLSQQYSGRMLGYMLAGLLFLLMSVQAIFTKISVPIIGLFVGAMSMVDFVSHEMGHILLGFFGDFIAVLGGTLAQLFLPSICLLLTARRKQWFLISLFAFWVGQSLIQVSTYVMDARAQQLKLFSPGALFGSGSPIHDWHYILEKTGLLWADQYLGGMIFILGLSLLFSAAGLMFARAVNIIPKNDE